MNSEIKDKKWLLGGICLQLGVGYVLGYGVYQIGTLITTGSFGAGFLPGLIAVAVMVAIVIYLCVNSDKKVKSEYALKSK
jgi:ferrous iron transport protein B